MKRFQNGDDPYTTFVTRIIMGMILFFISLEIRHLLVHFH